MAKLTKAQRSLAAKKGWRTRRRYANPGRKSPRDIFAYHQIQIAKSTLRMSDIGARIMGGMTKAEARAILRKYGIRFKE